MKLSGLNKIGRTSVISVLVLCALAGQLVAAQCPARCQCEPAKLICKNTKLTEVPTKEIESGVLKVDFSNNDINTILDKSFIDEVFSSVEILNISNNKIKKIEVNAFKNLKNLNLLDLSGNEIGFIEPDVFKTNVHLMSLYLNKNSNLRFPENGYDLPELVRFESEQCGIHRIPTNFFTNMRNLKFLYLSTNSLTYLEGTNFNHLTNLEVLDLSNNWFKELQRELLELHSSTKLSISNNPWLCDCHFSNVLDLYEWRKNNRTLICKNPEQLRGKVANKTIINELLHCNVKTTTTMRITTQYVEYEDELADWDGVSDLESVSDKDHMEKPADEGRPQKLVQPDEDQQQDETTPRIVQSSGVGGAAVFFDSLNSESWFEDNQWWIICGGVVILVAAVSVIINKQVNRHRKLNVVSIVQYEEDA